MADFMDGVYLGGCLEDDAQAAPPQLRLGKPMGLPDRVDLRGMCSPVEDQRKVGSCASNAVVGALEYHLRKSGKTQTDLSRLFLYYNARAVAKRENEMHGSVISHNMAATMVQGICPEAMWPYHEAMVTTRPTQACYEAGANLVGVNYARVEEADPTALKVALVNGLPVTVSVRMPREAYIAGLSGAVTRPQGGWWPRKTDSGHAMLLVGYDDARNAWLIRNSWGTDYGEGGYFWVDYEAMELYKNPSQFWAIGALDGQPGLEFAGPSVSQHLGALGSQYGISMEMIDRFRQSVRGTMERDIDQARQSIRDRLRGPGAGGGY